MAETHHVRVPQTHNASLETSASHMRGRAEKIEGMQIEFMRTCEDALQEIREEEPEVIQDFIHGLSEHDVGKDAVSQKMSESSDDGRDDVGSEDIEDASPAEQREMGRLQCAGAGATPDVSAEVIVDLIDSVGHDIAAKCNFPPNHFDVCLQPVKEAFSPETKKHVVTYPAQVVRGIMKKAAIVCADFSSVPSNKKAENQKDSGMRGP